MKRGCVRDRHVGVGVPVPEGKALGVYVSLWTPPDHRCSKSASAGTGERRRWGTRATGSTPRAHSSQEVRVQVQFQAAIPGPKGRHRSLLRVLRQ